MDLPRRAPQDFSVIAIIAAYNEADVIGPVVGDLIAQGVWVYLLDHASADGTVAAVEPYWGRGLLGIERFPHARGAAADAERFAWQAILERKEALARELTADWFIHHDADEFRESPWAGLGLAEAIRRVDRAGYNAIDFELLNFWPTHDDFRPGTDVRVAFPLYEPGQSWDRLQIRCWKNLGGPVDLASSGGHEARFLGRRVFPLRFILRHYPVRGQRHGERKVRLERRARVLPAERARGWHVQYDQVTEGHSFLRDPATLTVYDPDAVRVGLALRHRGVEELEARVDALEQAGAALRADVAAARADIARLGAEREVRRAEVARLEHEASRLLASRSWRWTAPLRAGWRLLGLR
jgi:hypothetical protein